MVEDLLVVSVIIKSEDEETVRGEAVKFELIVADILLSITENCAVTVVTEVGNSVTLGNVVMVASEGSMVLSVSETVGVATIVVPEFSLELDRITEAVGEAVGSSVLSEPLGLFVFITDGPVVRVGGNTKVTEGVVINMAGGIDDSILDSKVTEGKIAGEGDFVTTIVTVFSTAVIWDAVLAVLLLTPLSTMFEDVEGVVTGV